MSVPQYFIDADPKIMKIMLKTWDLAYYEAKEPLVSDKDYDDCLTLYKSLTSKNQPTEMAGAENETD